MAADKIVFSIYGKKGEGKTYAGLSVIKPNESALILSFDGMSELIQKQFFSNVNAEIYNVIKEPLDIFTDDMNEPVKTSVEAGARNTNELLKYLKSLQAQKKQYDWVVVDGYNIANILGELVMRNIYHLNAHQGVANMNAWKIRNSFLNALLDTAKSLSKIGVIYTLYSTTVDDIVDGIVVNRKSIPNYIGDIMYQTHVVIHIYQKLDKKDGSVRYSAEIETSKFKSIKPAIYDITNSYLYNFIRSK